MKSLMTSFALVSFIGHTNAQTNLILHLKDKVTGAPLIGAVAGIDGTSIGNVADTSGYAVLRGVPAGIQIFHIRALGYTDKFDTLQFPGHTADTLELLLEPSGEEMEEVVVSSTRSSRTIQTLPTRIELIGADELSEKANMQPGDIRMLLSESTGIQTLQTSATSGNSSIRIEGLDGRYTQILKDGFPIYAGFSGGLGLLQTPPLDLKRIEIIKGSSSTLYGGGAIAGLVNLISKTPSDTRELSFLVNGTTARGFDADGFYSQRWKKIGLTLYTAYNANDAYAPGNTEFAAIPQFFRYTFNPVLYITPGPKTDIKIGLNVSSESRLGGDIRYISGERDSVHLYFEDNKSERLSTQTEVKHQFGKNEFTFRNNVSYFARTIQTPSYSFDGMQTSTFSEMAYAFATRKMEWIAGGNFVTDAFDEQQLTLLHPRNYLLSTLGAFLQNVCDLSKYFVLETGLRGDYIEHYGNVLLPRISLLYKPGSSVSSRLGGGLGYKAPTIFTEESERIDYRNVLPVSSDSNRLERSYGGNWDVNYKTTFGGGAVRFSINQLLFYTRLYSPLELVQTGTGLYRFENLPAHIDAEGSETNIRLSYKRFTFFLGYTYTYSQLHEGGLIMETPLTPKHHTNSVLMYEVPGKLKIGAEAYYYSSQMFSDGTRSRDYWLCGLMGEKSWKHLSVFINFENLLNIRQSRFGKIYTGSVSNPQFNEIYAPLEGFVANGGIKLHL